MKTQKSNCRTYLYFAVTMICANAIPISASADPIHGSYEGLLFVGSGRVEGIMMNIDQGGNMIFVSEEGDNSDIDPNTGLVPNDFETTALGAWRQIGKRTLEFGVLGFRSGSGLCAPPITDDLPPKLPSCGFLFTGRLTQIAQIRGMDCDLGGNGRLGRRTIDGSFVEDVGIDIDYCLNRATVDEYLDLIPVP